MVDFLSELTAHERNERLSAILNPPVVEATPQGADGLEPGEALTDEEPGEALTDEAEAELIEAEPEAPLFMLETVVGRLGGRPTLLPVRSELSLAARFDADLSAYLAFRGVPFHRTVNANQQTFYYIEAASALVLLGLMQGYSRFPLIYTVNPIEKVKAVKRERMPTVKSFSVPDTAYINFRVYLAEGEVEARPEGQPVAVILCDRDDDGRWTPRGTHGPLRKLMPPTDGATTSFEHVDYLGRYHHALTPDGVESHVMDVARIETPRAGHIDLVYTWVDGEDPEWLARKAAATGGEAPVLRSSDNALRYLSRDELRFSLRSVSDYCPWVGTIYIVTDDQRPDWLIDHPRVKLVSHREIFADQSVLPVFNSHAIESQLHHIEGLSEYFIYMNDDFFFGRPNPIDIYYERNGIGKLLVSPTSFVDPTLNLDEMIPTDAAALNMQRLMMREFGILPIRKTLHAPYPLRKSIMAEMEARFADEWNATAAARVRSPTDLATVSMFYHHYAWATGRSVVRAPGSEKYRYVDIGKLGMGEKLDEILADPPHYFCINSTQFEEIPLDLQAELLKRFFERMFPVPSPFERV